MQHQWCKRTNKVIKLKETTQIIQSALVPFGFRVQRRRFGLSLSMCVLHKFVLKSITRYISYSDVPLCHIISVCVLFAPENLLGIYPINNYTEDKWSQDEKIYYAITVFVRDMKISNPHPFMWFIWSSMITIMLITKFKQL